MVGGKVGFLFPGQGAQYVGMGKEWVEPFDTVRQRFNEADELCGFSLSRICFEGPEEKLALTRYSQPAIFVTSFALFQALQENCSDLKPSFVAGLSLGEFTALTAAGALPFKEGLKLVKRRAELMDEAGKRSQGAMISIIGLGEGECVSIAKESGVELANLNAPDQFVLSGEEAGIKKAAHLADGMGAKRVIPLRVSGAFHSRLMKEAREGLEAALGEVTFSPPQAVFVPNITGRPESDTNKIRALLGEQVTGSVQWIRTMETARGLGIRQFIEVGPGRVLRGLAKRIDPSMEILPLEKISDLNQIQQRCLKTK